MLLRFTAKGCRLVINWLTIWWTDILGSQGEDVIPVKPAGSSIAEWEKKGRGFIQSNFKRFKKANTGLIDMDRQRSLKLREKRSYKEKKSSIEIHTRFLYN